MLPAIRSSLPIPQKVVVLMVGPKYDRPPVKDAVVGIGGDPMLILSVRGYVDFPDLAIALMARPDVALISISNETGRLRVDLSRECVDLVKFVMDHPQRPWIYFGDPKLNFLSTIFVRKGLRVFNGDGERATIIDLARIAGQRLQLA